MFTFQDFQNTPDGEKRNFVRTIIQSHIGSNDYRFAKTAQNYFNGDNETIMNMRKLLYTVTGKQIPDTFSTDWRLRANWFEYFVAQLNQYLLGNGVTWSEDDTKDKLGKKFDSNVNKLGEYALIHGVSFGFWNLDHLEPYSLLEFAPLYDEENGALMAGVRFWQIDSSKPLRATLMEPDGYTDLIWSKDREGKETTGVILHEKRPYIQIVRTSEADGTEIFDGLNYPTFPVVPLFGRKKRSELYGRQERIDCFDIISSGFANTIEEASYIYWAIQNAQGMRQQDLAKFIEQMKTLHAALVTDNGARAEAHSIETPYQGRQALLDELRTQLFYDFMAFDARQISGGAVIPQIEAAYEMLDQKANTFERNVFDFLDGIMAINGIEDTPTLTRSKITNKTEEIQMILQCTDALTDDYVTKKILTILGDGDLADDIIKQKEADDMQRVNIPEEEPEEQPEEVEENGGQGAPNNGSDNQANRRTPPERV